MAAFIRATQVQARCGPNTEKEDRNIHHLPRAYLQLRLAGKGENQFPTKESYWTYGPHYMAREQPGVVCKHKLSGSFVDFLFYVLFCFALAFLSYCFALLILIFLFCCFVIVFEKEHKIW